jgi:hypothetical protein
MRVPPQTSLHPSYSIAQYGLHVTIVPLEDHSVRQSVGGKYHRIQSGANLGFPKQGYGNHVNYMSNA